MVLELVLKKAYVVCIGMRCLGSSTLTDTEQSHEGADDLPQNLMKGGMIEPCASLPDVRDVAAEFGEFTMQDTTASVR